MGSRKKIVKLNIEQKSIIIGTILGDAYLQKTGEKNSRLRFEHSYKQKDYIVWKISKLPKLFQGKPKYLERKNPISGKTYRYLRHQSNSIPELGKLQKLFYPKGKKQIPDNLDNLLKNSLSLAVWYMDDGYYYARDKVSYLYLGKITKKEAEIANNAIKKSFKINCKVLDKGKKGFALYFSPEETIKLHKKIKPFVLESFGYKISF